MEQQGFDNLTRTYSRLLSRRSLAGVLGLSALGGLSLIDAKRKRRHNERKRCKRSKVRCGKGCCGAGRVCRDGICGPPAVPCVFTKAPTLWTLQGDCTTSDRIAIPDGVTLDGNGKTILAVGPITQFADSAILAATDGSAIVRNLRLDGRWLSGACPVQSGIYFYGIVFRNASGRIEDTVIEHLAPAPDGHCATAIWAVPDPEVPAVSAQVDLDHVTVRDCGGGVIHLVSDGTISDCTFEKVEAAILQDNGVNVVIRDNHITATQNGMVLYDTQAMVTGNVIQTDLVGILVVRSSITLEDNTITGTGRTGEGVSFSFEPGDASTVTGNRISNFECGIFVPEIAIGVTLGANTFPDPPGNEQNVCDNRP